MCCPLTPPSSRGGSLPLSGSGSGCLGLVGVISRGSLGSQATRGMDPSPGLGPGRLRQMDSWMSRVQTLAAGSLFASSLWGSPGSSLSCPLVQYSLLVPCGQSPVLHSFSPCLWPPRPWVPSKDRERAVYVLHLSGHMAASLPVPSLLRALQLTGVLFHFSLCLQDPPLPPISAQPSFPDVVLNPKGHASPGPPQSQRPLLESPARLSASPAGSQMGRGSGPRW